MQEIRCPNCGEVFQVDESGYNRIVQQIRDKEFSKELERREKELEAKRERELELIRLQEEKEYSEGDFLYGEKREGVCESGFDSGILDAMIEKGSAQAVYFGHDHVNNFGVMYKNILLSYIQPSGYGVYNMQSKFDAPENEWIQGATLINIKADGTFTAERIYNHS